MKRKIFKKSHSVLFAGLLIINMFGNTSKVNAQTPEWVWAKSTGNIEGEFAYSTVATDPSGNVYVAGYFESDSITFGSTTLINTGTINLFLVKYDANGNVLWAKTSDGANVNTDKFVSVTTDASGNVYAAGYFSSPSITFGLTTFLNSGNFDLMIVKYDSDGNMVWANNAGEAADEYAFSVTADVSGNIYMTGFFHSNTIIFGSITLTNTSAGFTDMFLVKYDPDGNELWAKKAGGGWNEYAESVTTDAFGNSYVTGHYLSPTLTFNVLNIVTNSDNTGTFYDLFIVKYDPSGNVVWASSAGSSNSDYAYSVSADASGASFVTGMFLSPSITFGLVTLTNPGDWNMYMVKYDSDGTVLWAKNAGGTHNIAQSVVADPTGSGGCYAGGYFNSLTTSFDTITLTNSNNNTSSDIFLVRYDADGNALWAKGADGNSNDQIFSVTADASGNVYVAGDYSSPTFVFDSTTLTCAGFYDMFIAKIGDTTLLLPVSAFASSDTLICEKFCIDFSDQSLNNPVSWNWVFEGGSPASSSDQNPANICYDDPGTFNVTLITTNANGVSDTLSLNNYITVNPNPFAPTITQSGNTLTSSSATSYQWYLNSNIIPGATDQNYTITQAGLYTVEVLNETGCKAQSSIKAYLVGIHEENGEFIMNILGNPTDNQLIIEVTGNSTTEWELVNVIGERLYQQKEKFTSSAKTFSIDISEIPSGIYFLIVHSGIKSKTFKVVKG